MSGALVVLEGTALPRVQPPPPWLHLMPAAKPLAFVVEGSQLFEIEPALFAELEQGRPDAERQLRTATGNAPPPPDAAADLAPPAAISLNIAQSCNLSCSYCYADEGRFGGRAEFMPLETAVEVIERTLTHARRRRVTIGFIGGEPFLNRPVLYQSVEYAARRAKELGIAAGFSITTNATLLNAADLDFLRKFAFALSVSLDGTTEMNDRERKSRDGSSASQTALVRLRPLLEDPGRARIAARSTITRLDLRVDERIAALALAGFEDIGVSPLRSSPVVELAFQPDDWPAYLTEMIRAAESEWRRLRQGDHWRFSNLATALKQIHAGAARTLPCGAGDNYVSVNARGEYFACHRMLADSRFALGADLDEGRRRSFLAQRHVDRQEPCRTCWARYLCGGGCHAEVLSNGRSGCDFIRGWLDFCLRFYDRVLRERPDLLVVREP